MTSHPPDKPDLKINEDSAPVPVPTFACIVYVSKSEDGTVQGRVANLAEMEAVGSSEREVLSKIVPQFKKVTAKYLADDLPIPWIQPPIAMRPDEQKRFIPVHL